MVLTKTPIFRIVLAALILTLFFSALSNSLKETHYWKATLGEINLQLEFALTPLERYTGLSNRSNLCDHCAMIFIFPKKANQTFVMRRMNFPLDIIWLDDKQIIGFSEKLNPEEKPYTPYNSPAPVNTVIEVSGGFVSQQKIKIGDLLEYETN